jgi:hypothetical protein
LTVAVILIFLMFWNTIPKILNINIQLLKLLLQSLCLEVIRIWSRYWVQYCSCLFLKSFCPNLFLFTLLDCLRRAIWYLYSSCFGLLEFLFLNRIRDNTRKWHLRLFAIIKLGIFSWASWFKSSKLFKIFSEKKLTNFFIALLELRQSLPGLSKLTYDYRPLIYIAQSLPS